MISLSANQLQAPYCRFYICSEVMDGRSLRTRTRATPKYHVHAGCPWNVPNLFRLKMLMVFYSGKTLLCPVLFELFRFQNEVRHMTKHNHHFDRRFWIVRDNSRVLKLWGCPHPCQLLTGHYLDGLSPTSFARKYHLLTVGAHKG